VRERHGAIAEQADAAGCGSGSGSGGCGAAADFVVSADVTAYK